MSDSTYEKQLEQHGFLVYKNVGTSMMPLLRPNRDLIVIRRKENTRCRKYDVILYRRPNGQCIIHRILKVRANDYILCGDNQIHREFGVKDGWILGVLSSVVRDGKETPVTDPIYRWYVHLWCDLFWIRIFILWCKLLPGRIRRIFK